MGFFSKQVLIFGLALGFSLTLFAEQEIRSSFRIQMPRKLSHGSNKLLDSTYSITKKVSLENFSFDSKYPSWAEDIQMNIDLQLSPLKVWHFEKPQDFHSTSISLTVNMGKTRTEFTEVRESPGSSITIDLKAQCENIKLTLVDDGAQLSGNVTIFNDGNKIRLELNQSEMQWSPTAWQTSPFQCTGVSGFERLAKEEIEKYLATPDRLQKRIFDELKKEIADLEAEINKKIFKKHQVYESAKNFVATMEPQLLLPHKDQEDYRFDGVTRLRFRGLSINKKNKTPLSFESSPPPSPHQEGPTFIFPIKIVQPMVEKLFANGNLFETWWSDELEGFSDFMKSDSQRRHVWPQMMLYPSTARFKFEAQVIKKPVVRGIKNNGERIEMFIDSTLVIRMYAPHKKGYFPYVEWTAPFTAHLSVQVFQGGFWYKVLSTSEFKWSAKMTPQYIKAFKPKDTKIKADQIGDAVIEALIKKQYRWAIPDWDVSDHLKYRAIKMFRTETLLWIYWEEVKPEQN